MHPVEPTSAIPAERRRYESVVDGILSLISAQQLEPGDALPTERELAGQFAVSRTVLRQAFGILEERGILTTRRGSGRYLRSVPENSDAPDVRSRMEIASIADVLEARVILEAEIVRLACQRRTSQEAAELVRAAGVLHAWEDNVAFHRTIAAATHNFALEHIVVEQMMLADTLHQRAHYRDADQLERMRSEHLAIAHAVSARADERAAELMRDHLAGTSHLLIDGSLAAPTGPEPSAD